MAVELTLGRFYKSKDKSTWCCFRLDRDGPEHCQAWCIEIATKRVEYFYTDGRYDKDGAREHTLVREVIVVDGFCTKCNEMLRPLDSEFRHIHCPKCGSPPIEHVVENFDRMWGEGDVMCRVKGCGTRVRLFDSG
jgi:hypothetical protein